MINFQKELESSLSQLVVDDDESSSKPQQIPQVRSSSTWTALALFQPIHNAIHSLAFAMLYRLLFVFLLFFLIVSIKWSYFYEKSSFNDDLPKMDIDSKVHPWLLCCHI